MLEQFGISGVANKLYGLTHKNPGESLDAIAGKLGIPMPEAERALDELSETGISTGTTTSMGVVSPVEASELLILRQENELSALVSSLISGRKQAKLLRQVNQGPFSGSSGGFEIVEGRGEVRNKIRAVNKSAERRMESLVPGGALADEAIGASKESNSQLVARGVQLKTVFLDSARKDHKTLQLLHWAAEVGVGVRTLPKLPIRLMIVDGKTAILPLNLNNAMEGIVVYSNEVAVKAFIELFDLTWDSAKPLGPKVDLRKKGLSDTEREVLLMLGQGKTDIEIGKKLGFTDRTVRRRIADLGDRLGAKTREQIIYTATKNGWI